MKTRVLASVALLPLLLVIVLATPGVFTAILFGAAAALAARELLVPTKLVQHRRLVLYSMICAFLTSLWSFWGAQHGWALLGVLALFALLFGEMMMSHTKLHVKNVAYCVLAGLVMPYLLTALVRVHSMSNGRVLILVAFVLAFLSDTGAYFVGMAFGKHKLAPIISPKKTIEGMIGGILAAVLGMLVYCVILQLSLGYQVNYLLAVLYGVLGAVGSVFGDLCFSVIKRQCGIKDYGHLIPGHGGVLDRFDSMMIVAPLTEALLLLLPVVVK
jgi:phosphatidate cytidylyltransferase